MRERFRAIASHSEQLCRLLNIILEMQEESLATVSVESISKNLLPCHKETSVDVIKVNNNFQVFVSTHKEYLMEYLPSL